ncbi:MAG: hypothetical protein ACOCRK_03840 [bacterium]
MKKPIRNAGIAGILCIISLLLIVITYFYAPDDMVFGIHFGLSLPLVLSNIFFFYGFIVLSKKLKNKFLKVISWIGLISFILAIGNYPHTIPSGVFLMTIIYFPGISETILSYLHYASILLPLFMIGVYLILFGLGILKSKKKLKSIKIIRSFSFSKIGSGIIVLGASLLFSSYIFNSRFFSFEYFLPLLLLFSFIILITYILDITLLFKVSRELEE